MEKFCTDFFLNSSMLYTLFGDKPMSGTTIAIPSEDWVAQSEWRLEGIPKRKREKAQKAMFDYCKTYDLHINWKKWQEWRTNKPSLRFLFRVTETKDPDLLNVDMINVKQVIFMMKKHYGIFKEELGEDFDPIALALEFEDPSSSGWATIFKSHYLMGILYGFGEENAYFFSREREAENNASISLPLSHILSAPRFPYQRPSTTSPYPPLPRFRSYTRSQVIEDPVLVKYTKSRRRIQQYLQDKNWMHKILAEFD